jgi:hypothetical protein
MKPKKAASLKRSGAAAAKAEAPEWRWQPWAWAAAAIVAVFWAYGPALGGAWIFDDTVLPYGRPAFPSSLLLWLKQGRPVLMLTYWLNRQIAPEGSSYGFHVTNLLIHLAAGGLMFMVARRFLEWSGAAPERRNLLAGFAAGVFLLHPAMTEAVAYTAGRSESHSTMWTLAAFAVFLYRPEPRSRGAGWRRYFCCSASRCSPRNKPPCCRPSCCSRTSGGIRDSLSKASEQTGGCTCR